MSSTVAAWFRLPPGTEGGLPGLAQALAHTSYTLGLYSIPPLVTTVAILLLGLLVLARERMSTTSVLFFAVALTSSTGLFFTSLTYSAPDPEAALWLARVAYLGIPFIAPATYQFTVTLLGIYHRYRYVVWTAWAASLVFMIAGLLTDVLVPRMQHHLWGYFSVYEWPGLIFILFLSGLLTASLLHFWQEYRAQASSRQRRRIRLLTLAFGVGSVGAVDFLAAYGVSVPILGGPIYPAGYIAVFGFVVIAARAIWTYRLADITPATAATGIIDIMSDALLVLDGSGSVRVVNMAACELFGKPR